MLRFIEMLDSVSPYSITKENIVVGTPVASLDRGNTKVLLTGSFNNGHYGQRTFTYNRIDLSGLRQRTVYIDNETDFLSILDKINTNAIFSYALGSGNNQTARQGFLLSSDIVNEPINQAVGETREYTLRAHPNSYLYMGALKLKLIS